MKKRNKNNKSFLLLASLALIVTAVIGTTMAYLVSDTPTVTNTFTPATVGSNIIEENFDGTIKENVKIQNTGDIKAYIRAKVVVTWQDTVGNVYAQKPLEGTDYNIEYNLENGWSKGKGSDGFFYWALPVNPHVESEHPENDDCYTGVLITSCSPQEGAAPDGYNLHVEILAEAIQADGMGATSAEDAWAIAKGNQTN